MNVKEYAEALLRLPQHMMSHPIHSLPMTNFAGTIFVADNAASPPVVLRYINARVGWRNTSEPEIAR